MYLQVIRASYAKIPLFLPVAKARGISRVFQYLQSHPHPTGDITLVVNP